MAHPNLPRTDRALSVPSCASPNSTCSCGPPVLCFKPDSIKVNNNTRTELSPEGERWGKGLSGPRWPGSICPLKFPGRRGDLLGRQVILTWQGCLSGPC